MKQSGRKQASKSVKRPNGFYNWLRSGWKLVAGFGTILGIVVTLYGLSARVVVSCDSAIDPQKPFSSPFTVDNMGVLPIYDVHLSCTLRNVTWQDGGVANIRTRTDTEPIKRIRAGETTTTFCRFLPYKGTIESGDIEVEVIYRPTYLSWSKESSFRFGTVKESSGTLRWVPKALCE